LFRIDGGGPVVSRRMGFASNHAPRRLHPLLNPVGFHEKRTSAWTGARGDVRLGLAITADRLQGADEC
jgi:hypothetical protein